MTNRKTQQFFVKEEQNGTRLDHFLVGVLADKTRSWVQKCIENELVQIGGQTAKKNAKVQHGDVVEILFPEPIPDKAEPEDIPIEIVYEDDALLVVNKKKGMVVHPAPGNYTRTLVNALLFHCGGRLSNINGVIRPGIVHRIDKDTSGLLIVAKTDSAHKALSEQIASHSFLREYETIVVGHLREQNGIIDAPIARNPKDRKKMAVVSDGRNAVTEYEVLAEYKGFSHLRCRLQTGRTHQIRVHFAHLGHPVAGDEVYGAKRESFLNGQCLHAKKIGFHHPKSGEYIEFDSPLPAYFTDFLAKLNKQG